MPAPRRLSLALLALALLGAGAFALLRATATAADEPAVPRAGRYEVSAGNSYVGYRIHKWGVVPVRGHFRDVAGEVIVDAARPAASSARVRVAVASLESGNTTRTEVVLSEDFFDAARHPEMRFDTRRVERRPDGVWQVAGVLTIRGVARTFDLPVTVHEHPEGGGDWLLFSTRFVLDRRDFEVLGRRWSAGRAILGNEVEIELALAARRSGRA
jgi:polyisoprenoid-binding protein YceI